MESPACDLSPEACNTLHTLCAFYDVSAQMAIYLGSVGTFYGCSVAVIDFSSVKDDK